MFLIFKRDLLKNSIKLNKKNIKMRLITFYHG